MAGRTCSAALDIFGHPVSWRDLIFQIVLLDIVFSLDSVITAVGMANEFSIMATAIVIVVPIMLVASGPVSDFVNRHPTVKTLALSFLLLIGIKLIADGVGFHVPKGFIYAAIGFSAAAKALNQLARHRQGASMTQHDEELMQSSVFYPLRSDL